MQITRILTYFWQHTLIALLCATSIVAPIAFTTGCNSAQVITVISDITKFAPIAVNVLQLACAFDPSASLCKTGVASLNATITELQAALTTYEQQLAAGTATVAEWNILNAIFATFEAQTADIFALFHISGAASQSEALAVAAAAQTLLAVIEALFPPAPATTAAASVTAPPHARAAMYVSSLPPGGVEFFNIKGWQKDYNRKVDAAKKANPKAVLVHVSVV
jgi:hypothetical protein